MSGHWPPEWEDPEEEFSGENEQPDTEAEARLSEVAVFLATVSAPAMPDAVESRISAALAAEAATRTGGNTAPADDSRILRPAPARARVRRRHGDGGEPRRRFRVRPQVVGGSLVTVVLVAAIGFGLSHAGSSSSSSGAAAGSAAEPNVGAASSAVSSAAAAGPISAPSAVPSPESSSAKPRAEHTVSPTFAVTMSGTNYRQETLAAQVKAKLAVTGGQTTFGATVPAGSGSAGSASSPSPALRGCVAHFISGTPRLVDRASYNGLQAYVIASATHVWVVGLGCTAAKPELIASVPLAG